MATKTTINKKETEEDDDDLRLLRKARDYVERHDRKRKQQQQQDDDDDSFRRREPKKPSRRHKSKERSSRKKHKGDHHHRDRDRDDHNSDDDDDSSQRHKSSRRSGKRRSSPRGEKKKKTRKQKESSRKRSSSKHDKKERKRRKLNRERTKSPPRSNVLYPLGGIRGTPPEQLLNVEGDYYAFHQHLWLYLYRTEGVVFCDLSSTEAHSAFERFCRKYNSGQLERAYYSSKLPPEAIEECKTTNFQWSFQTSETERKNLHLLQEGVRKQTEYEGSGNDKNKTNDIPITTTGGPSRSYTSTATATAAPRSSSVGSAPKKDDEEEGTGRRRRLAHDGGMAQRTANRQFQSHVRTVEEELAGGRKEGRERQLEKKRERSEALHGAARDREEVQMGGVELTDDVIYGDSGGGGRSFHDALARERQRQAQRRQKNDARLAELQQKEQNKQEAMLQKLGLAGIVNVKAGQKIKIPPRNDNDDAPS